MVENKSNALGKLQIWLPLLFALVLVAGMLIGMRLQAPASAVIVETGEDAFLSGPGQGKIEELIRYVEAKYVDEVDRDQLVQQAIDHILENLDPHSNYISAEQLQEVNEQLEGSFDGIGVEFMILDDTIVVVAPLAGGPSEAVGIQAGDKIVAIEDSLIAGVNINTRDVINMLRGEKGSKVAVSIIRGKKNQLRHFTITRDEIPMHSVDVAYMLNEKTGYIKVNRFSATTYEEFMRGLERLVDEKGMKDLVIDVRHNPGGYLQQATNILSQLFKEKERLLVYTEGRSIHRSDYSTTGRALFDIDDIVVLIDEGSASASEILAGAVQDHDRGVIIGRRSFGKGLVQEQYMLRDGSALRLTVARYYTPSGRSIQKSYQDMDAYDNDVIERYESGELYSREKVTLADSTRYYTDAGRVVYGGGGIMPDFFVPLDSTNLSDYFLELRQHVPQFVFRYMDENQKEFEKYDLETFRRNFRVSSRLLNDFLDYAKQKEVTIKQGRLAGSKEDLIRLIKARIAKHLFEDEGFYTVWNEKDPMVKKALEVLQSPNPISSK